jgi:hypothetical protein
LVSIETSTASQRTLVVIEKAGASSKALPAVFHDDVFTETGPRVLRLCETLERRGDSLEALAAFRRLLIARSALEGAPVVRDRQGGRERCGATDGARLGREPRWERRSLGSSWREHDRIDNGHDSALGLGKCELLESVYDAAPNRAIGQGISVQDRVGNGTIAINHKSNHNAPL